jgi:hypothetical protein
VGVTAIGASGHQVVASATSTAVAESASSGTAVGESASSGAHRRWPDVLGVLWVVLAPCVALVPALVHGLYLGPYDRWAIYGITARPGVLVHNAAVGDLTDQIIPWINLAWTQVHHGHLPLWNGYEALGIPLAFNFGSGAFSLPALISYVGPMRDAFLVQVVVSLVVGGTGAYFFGRVMRLHPVASAFAGTTWVLSGPLFGYLGLPDTSVMSWAGWQFAAALLIIRGTHRLLSVLLLAVSLAFSILAGNPQIEVLIVLALVVFVVVMLVHRTDALHRRERILRPIGDLAMAGVAGCALAAPIALPGLQLANASVRTTSGFAVADPVSQVLGTMFQSFWGLPLAGSWVNEQGFYPVQWVWVGALAVVLSIVAVGVRWRRPEVRALALAAVVTAAANVLQPVDALLDKLPLIGHTWWSRSLIPLAFCLAMLAGIGLDTLLRGSERRQAVRWGFGSSGAIAVVLGLVWLFGRGDLPGWEAHLRAESFVWPVLSVVAGVVGFGTIALLQRRSTDTSKTATRSMWSRWPVAVAVALLTFQTVFLIVLDEPLESSTSTPYQATPAVSALQRAVGSSLVGLGGVKGLNEMNPGFAPNTNIPFGIHQFAVYDPIAPTSWFTSWASTNHSSPGAEENYAFVPGIESATVARRYGVSYVLEPAGARGPTGGVFVRSLGSEDLYRIPGAAPATLVPAGHSHAWPSIDAHGSATPVKWISPSKLRIETSSSAPRVLRVRVASVPGWHATIDGRPLPTSPYLSMMFQARVPPGHHVVEFSYWPQRFTEGVVLALLAVVGFVVAGIVVWRARLRGEKAKVKRARSGRRLVDASDVP